MIRTRSAFSTQLKTSPSNSAPRNLKSSRSWITSVSEGRSPIMRPMGPLGVSSVDPGILPDHFNSCSGSSTAKPCRMSNCPISDRTRPIFPGSISPRTNRYPSACSCRDRTAWSLVEAATALRGARERSAMGALSWGSPASGGCQRIEDQRHLPIQMVGARGFEPPTPWSRTRCSTRLSHAPSLNQRQAAGERNSAQDFNSELNSRAVWSSLSGVMETQPERTAT